MDEYGYFSKDVALKLEINTSTLRQWCKALEDEGYEIERNTKNQRIFYERDINMLFELKVLIEKTRNRDNAIKTIVSRYKSPINTIRSRSDNDNNHDNQQLLNYIQKQESFNKKLLERLDEQRIYIDERLETRDKHLMEVLNRSIETQKMIAATKEDKEKKSFFSWLFFKK